MGDEKKIPTNFVGRSYESIVKDLDAIEDALAIQKRMARFRFTNYHMSDDSEYDPEGERMDNERQTYNYLNDNEFFKELLIKFEEVKSVKEYLVGKHKETIIHQTQSDSNTNDNNTSTQRESNETTK
jgi:hypothetical protein